MSSNESRRVAVLGAAGNVGKGACAGLVAAGHYVRGIDINNEPPPGLSDFRCVDITDREALEEALQEINTVVHLAGYLTEGAPRNILLGPSFLGTWNVFEAAVACGVERLILPSTNQVVDNPEEQDRLVTADDPFHPTSIYGISKITMEMMGRLWASEHPLTVLIVRIGWMPFDRAEMEAVNTSLRRLNIYFSFDDAGCFFARAVEADLPHPGVEVVYAMSKGVKPEGGLDREPARRLLGYEAQDTWPEGYAQFTD